MLCVAEERRKELANIGNNKTQTVTTMHYLKQKTRSGKGRDAGRPKIVEKLIGCYGIRRVTLLTEQSNLDQIFNCAECRLFKH